MNTIAPGRHNYSEKFITFKVSRRLRKNDYYIAQEGSGLAFFSMDRGHIFGKNVGTEFGVTLRGKGPHKPEIAFDIVHIHSSMKYTELIEHKMLSNTKTPLLRCFFFTSKLTAGDVITTGQYINIQAFTTLPFRPLLEKFFPSIHIDLRNTSCEKVSSYNLGITRFVLMFRKTSNLHL